MTDNGDSQTRKWAVLIGINLYLNDKSLKGCSRDVGTIEQYLRNGIRPDETDIVTLTANASSESRSPRESPDQLPTYAEKSTGIIQTAHCSFPLLRAHGSRLWTPFGSLICTMVSRRVLIAEAVLFSVGRDLPFRSLALLHILLSARNFRYPLDTKRVGVYSG